MGQMGGEMTRGGFEKIRSETGDFGHFGYCVQSEGGNFLDRNDPIGNLMDFEIEIDLYYQIQEIGS